MMGLYQFKEFLSLDDVAEYLKDKGVYDFDLTCGIEQNKLLEYLDYLEFNNGLTKVFYIDGLFEISVLDDDDLLLYDQFRKELKGYFVIDKNLIDLGSTFMKLYQCDQASRIWLDERGKKNGWSSSSGFLIEYKFIPDITFNFEQLPIYYPKKELDAIFATFVININQQGIAELQANDDEMVKLQTQLKVKDERIAELERQLNDRSTPDDVELTGTSKKAVTKLLYALLLEHNYSIDGATKGVTNQILVNLTTNHNVGVSRETIANWLNEINTLHHDKNK